MASKSRTPFSERAANHPNPLVRRLFEVAEAKKTNVTLSADVSTTEELLQITNDVGPYIAVLKTHHDVVSDFGPKTVKGLQHLAKEHNFLIFEDRKFVDIGNTVKDQYCRSRDRIYDWADIVNVAMTPGEGVVQALDQVIETGRATAAFTRGILILAEMTSKGSLAVGDYTSVSVEVAKKYKSSVIGFVATRELSSCATTAPTTDEDFVVFTTGVNLACKGDALGQQYQTPQSAVERGADFIIAGRGICSSPDPVAAVKQYRKAAWDAYESRIGNS